MTFIKLLITLLIWTNSSVNKIGDHKLYIQAEGRDTIRSQEWELVWSDEFNNNKLDSTKWSRITNPSHNVSPPWRRYMTDDDICYDIRDSKIYLKGVTNRDSIADARQFLTGGISTKDKFAFQYGRIEIRAKLGSAKGSWPAIWMLPQNSPYGGWPKGGEIDIMEQINRENRIYQTIHTHFTYTLNREETKHGAISQADITLFNIFAIEWYPDRFEFFINGEKTFTYNKQDLESELRQWPFDTPFYLLVDQQLGGNWAGDVDSKDLPVEMVIDWVRVYQ